MGLFGGYDKISNHLDTPDMLDFFCGVGPAEGADGTVDTRTEHT